MTGRLAALYDPPRFQSAGRRDGWFEGWYFKLVDSEGLHPLAVIPGVSRDDRGGTSHSFVQLIRPDGTVRYHSYDFDAFRYEPDRFAISVGPSRFSADGIHLELPPLDAEGPVLAEVGFGPLSPWPVTIASPGIMGWYRYVPRMECYHGVISMDHDLSGFVEIGGRRLDFTDGKGYSEKDWGTSFPSSWIWAQANHFTDDTGAARPGVSVTLSVARIPWLGSAFTGHIAGVLLDGRLHRFATYTGSKLLSVESRPGGASVSVGDRHHRLTIDIEGAKTGALKAPVLGAMSGRADEALDARVRMEVHEVGGAKPRLLFAGTSTCAGTEIMNDRGELSAD